MEEWDEIKRGVNVYHYYFTIIILFVFILINYYSRDFKVEALNITFMISVVTFLFGFLMNTNFSFLTKKVHSLKEGLARETANLISMYFFSKKLGEKFHQEIVELIDNYTIYTLRNFKHYEEGRPFIYKMYETLDLAEVNSDHKKSSFSGFVSSLNSLEETREELEYLTSSKLEISLKVAYYLLGCILIILLFLNRGDTFTNLLFIILSTCIIFIFLIIEDYDDLKIGDYSANISNSEQIFDLIGKTRYYPQEVLSKVSLEKGKKYRIGIYDSKEKKEKIFEIIYGKNKEKKVKKSTDNK